jgi:hypothetical protein
MLNCLYYTYFFRQVNNFFQRGTRRAFSRFARSAAMAVFIFLPAAPLPPGALSGRERKDEKRKERVVPAL